MQNLPIRRLTSARAVDTHCGEWLNSSADFNPNRNYVNAAAPKQASFQTTSRPHHHATLMQNYCINNVLVSPTICKIKIKRSGIGHQIFKIFFLSGVDKRCEPAADVQRWEESAPLLRQSQCSLLLTCPPLQVQLSSLFSLSLLFVQN